MDLKATDGLEVDAGRRVEILVQIACGHSQLPLVAYAGTVDSLPDE
jgi:hypothetical protein